MRYSKIFLLVPFLLLFCFTAVASDWQKEEHWDWHSINLDDTTFWQTLHFPADFTWGVATAAFTIEGTKTHSNQHIQNNYSINNSQLQNNSMLDHWDRYKRDVQLIKQLGVNQYRFSIPWEKIEPTKGHYDIQAMWHYKDLVAELKKNNIEPFVCLFHFTMPVWFYALGGFEKEENLHYFIKFCTYVFKELHNDVTFWSIYNEPIAYAMEAYHTGRRPPYQKGMLGLITAGEVIKNMLSAHVTIYQQCKHYSPNAQIGLIQMFHPLDPYQGTFIEHVVCNLGNKLMHDSILNFFKDGTFSWLFNWISYTNVQAPHCLDFIGVNYYTHDIIKSKNIIGFERGPFREGESKVPGGKRLIYPEGLYRSIKKAAELKKPIYVTENGIADPTDKERNDFIKKHLYAVQYAYDEGFDVRGYTYWSFIDVTPYGLYAVDPITKERTLRESAKPFVAFCSSF